MPQVSPRPAYISDEMLAYLASLRNAGTVDMFAVTGQLQRRFQLTPALARSVVLYWIQTNSASVSQSDPVG